MGFLRRLFGGDERSDARDAEPLDPAERDASEREHELDVIREEQERLDELTQRQLRYERYAWQPPAQGGERRADDKEDSSSGG